MKNLFANLLLLISITTVLIAGNKDVYKTNSGDLTLTMIGWSGLQFESISYYHRLLCEKTRRLTQITILWLSRLYFYYSFAFRSF